MLMMVVMKPPLVHMHFMLIMLAHGHNNEDELNDALEKMNNLFNSIRRDLQIIKKEFRKELRSTRREVTSMNKKFETVIPKTNIAKTISVNPLIVNTNLI